VRIKQTGSKYDGDLALVEKVRGQNRVELKVIPREYTPEQEMLIEAQEKTAAAARGVPVRGNASNFTKREEKLEDDDQGLGDGAGGRKHGGAKDKKKYTRENRPPQVLRVQKKSKDDAAEDDSTPLLPDYDTLRGIDVKYIETDSVDPSPEELCQFFNESNLQRVIERHARLLASTKFGDIPFVKGEVVRVVSGPLVH
jgi:hypothetical protein